MWSDWEKGITIHFASKGSEEDTLRMTDTWVVDMSDMHRLEERPKNRHQGRVSTDIDWKERGINIWQCVILSLGRQSRRLRLSPSSYRQSLWGGPASEAICSGWVAASRCSTEWWSRTDGGQSEWHRHDAYTDRCRLEIAASINKQQDWQRCAPSLQSDDISR